MKTFKNRKQAYEKVNLVVLVNCVFQSNFWDSNKIKTQIFNLQACIKANLPGKRRTKP